MHTHPIGPVPQPANPVNPITPAERRVLDETGQHEGPAIVDLVREAQAPPPAQVHHVTTQVTVPCHTHEQEDNLDVLIAFVIAVIVFFLSWWIIGANTDMSTWNDARWAGFVGLSVGFVYLAVSNGVRRVTR